MAKNEKKQKRRLSPVEKATNVVLTLVVLGILALAVYAVTPKLKAGYQRMQEEKAQEQQMQEAMNAPQEPITVAVAAEQMQVSVDEFKAEFGLGDDVTAESDVDAIFTEEFVNGLSLGKFAKMNIGIVKEDGTKYTDEEAFAMFDEFYQFEDSVTPETTYGEVKDYMAQKDAEMQEAMQQAPADGEAQTEGEVPAEGEAPAENE